jgi:cephalosporin hydroxylase
MIASKYSELCRAPSDINEHLPTLARYASACTTVTECGVRSGVSSYAFAEALKNTPNARITQVDLDWHPNIGTFQKDCAKEGLRTTFYGMSDLECPLDQTDMLFLDTWHVYGHLKRELARWHPYVNKYIAMHDTTVDGVYGETIRNRWDARKQSIQSGIPIEEINRGLLPAIEEFLAEHPEWILRERFVNNNGLTLLEKKSQDPEVSVPIIASDSSMENGFVATSMA